MPALQWHRLIREAIRSYPASGIDSLPVSLAELSRSCGRVILQEGYISVATRNELPGVLNYRQRVAAHVTPKRLAHILRVVRLAESIAIGNHFDSYEQRSTVLAALLHDAARDLGSEELFDLAPPQNELELRHPLAVHGRASRRLAEQWGVTDERVLAAVAGHVFGVPSDDRIGMAVYVADVSEPGRGVNGEIRELALRDLESAYRRAVVSKVEYLRACGKPVHPVTLQVYEQLRNA